jgi:hypothetical protein
MVLFESLLAFPQQIRRPFPPVFFGRLIRLVRRAKINFEALNADTRCNLSTLGSMCALQSSLVAISVSSENESSRAAAPPEDELMADRDCPIAVCSARPD